VVIHLGNPGLITGGHVPDCTAGALLLERLPACRLLHADKGYDSDAIRRQIEARRTAPNISPKANHQRRPVQPTKRQGLGELRPVVPLAALHLHELGKELPTPPFEKSSTALRCASSPSPDRPCLSVETRR
jgi:hypothetical protein